MSGEKTEKATPKRRQEERKKGNIFQSRDVVVVFSLVIMFYTMRFLSPYIYATLERGLTQFIVAGGQITEITIPDTRKLMIDTFIILGITIFPLLIVSGLVAIIFTAMQTKLLFSTKSMAFKFNRINPLSGLKKMFSLRSIVELLKSLIKIAVLTGIIYSVVSKRLPGMPNLMDMSVTQAVAIVGDTIMSIVVTTAVVFIFVAGFDYFYQWWEYEKNMRMSKQEIKEEYKQTEGDPQVKGKIKEKQRAAANRRMMQNVPNADVIIRNPTHFAVAIQYNPEKSSAPIVVAKGADNIALKIIEIAEQHDIIVTENKPLARGLYETVDVDREIPDSFYQPVAEVLAFVYSLKKKELK